MQKNIEFLGKDLLMFKRILISSAVAVLVAACGSSSDQEDIGTSNAESSSTHLGWTYEELKPLNIPGVSPEVISENGTIYLYSTDMGIKLYKSTDGINFEQVANAKMPMAADPTIIKTSDGKWNLYVTEVMMNGPKPEPGQAPQPMDPKKTQKIVKVSTSDSLENFGPGVETGIVQAKPGAAWGVPDTTVDPTGKIRMFWVDMDEGDKWESIKSGTSSDGITFTVDEGIRFTDAYVDPYVLKAQEGDWVMLLSTTPAKERLPQKFYLAWSTDGMSWKVDSEPLIDNPDKNYLDPTAYEISPGVWRVYVSTSDKANAIGGPYSLETFILKAPIK